MNYLRVIPRDFFNESKLLKGLGRLSLLELNGNRYNIKIRLERDEQSPFTIKQNPFTGNLYDASTLVYINDKIVSVSQQYNCKASYGLIWENNDSSDFVFKDNGEFTEEFIENFKIQF